MLVRGENRACDSLRVGGDRQIANRRGSPLLVAVGRPARRPGGQDMLVSGFAPKPVRRVYNTRFAVVANAAMDPSPDLFGPAITLAPVKDTSSGSIPTDLDTVELQLRWGDLDTNHHVNNVQFARLFEEARVRTVTRWFATQGRSTGAFHLARQEIEFVAPLYYGPEPVTAKVWISRLGTSSFDFASELRDGKGNLVGLCETTGVMIDPETGGTRPVPDAVRDLLEAKMADPVPFRRRA